MNNFPCVNSILIDRHLATLDADDHFNDWLSDYEMTQDDFLHVIETMLDEDNLVPIFDSLQFAFANGLEVGKYKELKELIDESPDEQIYYIASMISDLDIDELASIYVKAYESKDTKKNYLLNGLEDAVIYYMDNEPSLYQRYQDEMEARHNDY